MKYVALAQALEQDIRNGRYQPGEKILPEKQLASSFRVAHLTVRQALQLLQEKGLINRLHGRGTFVNDPRTPWVSSRRRPVSSVTAYLLGLGPVFAETHDPVNWQTRLLRYQGIAEGGFKFGISIQCRTVLGHESDVPWLLDQFKDAPGLILHDDPITEKAIVRLRERGVAVVAINRHGTTGACSEIQVDTRRGAFLAVQHLLKLGHRRIGIVVGDLAIPVHRLRLEGYRDALQAYGVSLDPDLTVIEPRGFLEEGAAAARRLLALPQPPTAFFAASDQRAIGILGALAEAGLRVPEQVAVVGFNDIGEAEKAQPPLTTVRNPLYESGFEAVRLLDEHLQSPGREVEVRKLPAELVVRESCGASARAASPSHPSMRDGLLAESGTVVSERKRD
ncbi:MAG: substrate-binding domain-containing protein [Planctomycetes bacterium]|nr:substrate-binding domain-containing protein [Planctomycetota bacterium]